MMVVARALELARESSELEGIGEVEGSATVQCCRRP